MSVLISATTSFVVMSGILAQARSDAEQVRQTVKAFYDAFSSHDVSRAVDFTTDDWTHVNPMGGWTRGREAVLNELKEVHATVLKGVSDTPEEQRLASVTIEPPTRVQ
jgi:ketosteroid isomerase-like protein